jgi:hypothetical protein
MKRSRLTGRHRTVRLPWLLSRVDNTGLAGFEGAERVSECVDRSKPT